MTLKLFRVHGSYPYTMHIHERSHRRIQSHTFRNSTLLWLFHFWVRKLVDIAINDICFFAHICHYITFDSFSFMSILSLVFFKIQIENELIATKQRVNSCLDSARSYIGIIASAFSPPPYSVFTTLMFLLSFCGSILLIFYESAIVIIHFISIY